MAEGVGRSSWLSLTPEEVKVLETVAALRVVGLGLDGAEKHAAMLSLFESLLKKTAAQKQKRFASIRLNAQEVDSLVPAFKAALRLLENYKAGTTPNPADPPQSVLLEHFPELAQAPSRASVLEQKMKAFQVKIGLQKRWVKGINR